MPENRFDTVIGLEVHIQLATHSKAFCGDSTAFGGAPNTQVSPISLGHPGTLPRLNARQVEYALRLGMALGSEINTRNAFDRKNYFYADLPKGYQITQDREPICRSGTFPIRVGEEEREVAIHHIHMEEDAGKSMHDVEPDHSLIDLNRAGVPLLELVTEPDLRSAEEVDAFMSGMRQLVRYLGISDGNMEEGSMRCDINVSLKPAGGEELGQRCEIKNINSMRYARRAIAFEVERQQAILVEGGSIEQQTLHFDPSSGQTSPLRDKEEAHDYRYFPEPDLPPLQLDKEFLEGVRQSLPALPWELYHAFQETYGLSAYEAALLSEDLETATYYQSFAAASPSNKIAANLLINRILPLCKENGWALDAFPVQQEKLAMLVGMIDSDQVSNTVAFQQVLTAMISRPGQAPLDLARELNLLQTSDQELLGSLVDDVLEANPDKVATYRSGKKGLLGFFMGEIMKRSRGKADPKLTQKLLRDKLD